MCSRRSRSLASKTDSGRPSSGYGSSSGYEKGSSFGTTRALCSRLPLARFSRQARSNRLIAFSLLPLSRYARGRSRTPRVRLRRRRPRVTAWTPPRLHTGAVSSGPHLGSALPDGDLLLCVPLFTSSLVVDGCTSTTRLVDRLPSVNGRSRPITSKSDLLSRSAKIR